MTLLEATATMIDAVKTWAPDHDKKLNSAVKRMERRLEVLRLRELRALSRRRSKGWKDLEVLEQSCPGCGERFCFEEFIKTAQLNGRGDILQFDCPCCSRNVVRLEISNGVSCRKCSRYVVNKL